VADVIWHFWGTSSAPLMCNADATCAAVVAGDTCNNIIAGSCNIPQRTTCGNDISATADSYVGDVAANIF